MMARTGSGEPGKAAAHDEAGTAATSTPPRRKHRGVWGVTVAVLFALLYGYDLWEAISNLVAVPAQLAEYNVFLIDNGLTPLAVPWSILIANLVVPPIAFGCAWWLGRRHGVAVQALMFLAGLGVVGALTLTFTALL